MDLSLYVRLYRLILLSLHAISGTLLYTTTFFQKNDFMEVSNCKVVLDKVVEWNLLFLNLYHLCSNLTSF